MLDIFDQLGTRIIDALTVAAIDRGSITVLGEQSVECALIRTHCAAGWRDDDGTVSQYDIAGKQRTFFSEREDEVIESMARCIDDLEGRIIEFEPLAIFKRSIDRKFCVCMRPHRCAGPPRERGSSRGMIRMTVRHQNRSNLRAELTRGCDDRIDVFLDERAGIDDEQTIG